MGKEIFQIYLNTTNPNAQNVSAPTLLSGICSVTAGLSVLTINSIDTTMFNSLGQYVYYVPLVYGMQILIPYLSASPIYILTQITGLAGGAGTYYMSYTPLATVGFIPFTGLPNKSSYNFLINWDSIFNQFNDKIINNNNRRCKIGVDFVSAQTVFAYTSSEIGVGEYQNGVLTCNLASNRGNKNLPYSVLGATDILNTAIEDPAILAVAPSYKSLYFKLNTMQPSQRTEFILPSGCSYLNLALYSWDNTTLAFTPQMIDTDWYAILSIEII